MEDLVGVLVVDQFSRGDPVLKARLAHSPALRIISECDLDRDEPRSKVALIGVQEPHVIAARSHIACLRRRCPLLRVLVAFQALKGADLRLLVDAGVDAFLAHSARTDDIGEDDICETLTTLAKAGCLPDDTEGSFASGAGTSLGLTKREIEIVRLIGSGLTNKDVARLLALSPRTIEVHRHNVGRKVQVKGRKGLVLLARQLRLDPVPDVQASEIHRSPIQGQTVP